MSYVLIVNRPKKGDKVVGLFPTEESALDWFDKAEGLHPKWTSCGVFELSSADEMLKSKERAQTGREESC